MESSQVFSTKDEYKLFVVHLKSENLAQTTCVEGKWLEFDAASRVFVQQRSQTLILPCSASSATIIACENVVDAVTGHKVPYVVVAVKYSEDENEPLTTFFLCANDNLCIAASTTFKPYLGRCRLPGDSFSFLKKSSKLIDGPTLLILNETSGHFHFIYRICNVGSTCLVTSELDHYLGQINFKDSTDRRGDVQYDSLNFHRFLYATVKFSNWHRTTVLEMHSIHSSRTLLGTNKAENPPSLFLQTTVQITDGGQNIEQQTSTSNLIPDVYASVCTSILSIPNSRCHSFHHENHNDAETNSSGDIVACTKFGQMVQFCYNHLFSCQDIPAIDVDHIHSIDAFDNEYVVATSPDQGVIAARLEDLKICGHWKSAKHVIVGDFLKKGTEQLLLLPPDGWVENDIITYFCLTDFGFCCIDTLDNYESLGEPMEDGETNNLGTIVEHLQSRVQCGMSALQEAKSHCREKMDLAEKTGKSLLEMNMRCNGETDLNKDNKLNMVDLLGHGARGLMRPPNRTGGGDCVPFEVVEVWQRMVVNKWVVGMDVVNQTGRDISEISLALIQDSDDVPKLKSNSKVEKCIKSQTTKTPQRPQSKRRKVTTRNGVLSNAPDLDDEATILTLIAVTDLPKFSFPTISCRLLLQWSFANDTIDGHPCNGAGDAIGSVHAYTCRWVCGSISLEAEDVVSEKYHVKLKTDTQDVSDVRRILQCLNACQTETPLHLKSNFLSGDVLKKVLERLGLVHHPMYRSYIDLDLGMFYMLRVDIDLDPRGSSIGGARVIVHTNDEKQLMIFIHMLYSDLPSDLKVIHGHQGDMAAAMESALSYMVKEVNQSCSGINKVLKSGSHADSMDFDDNANGDVMSLRQSFEQKKRKFVDDDLKPSASEPVLSFTALRSHTDAAVSQMMKRSESF